VYNNTPVKYIETKFKTTPKMSTYLVGWAIVPNMFTYEELKTVVGTPVRIYSKAVAKKEGLLAHALEVAKKSIDFFERDYLDISEAVLPKIGN
jgi:aminopeptidase N